VPEGIHVHALADHNVAASGLDPELLRYCYLVSDRPWKGGQVDAELRDLLNDGPDPALRRDRTTLFVATGIGLQDFSVQRTLLQLATEMSVGAELSIMAIPDDPKDLYGCLVKSTAN
jgi:ornithine cyclodeaminase/alanine dehydrogenase-like protein (mu-crystallin family)